MKRAPVPPTAAPGVLLSRAEVARRLGGASTAHVDTLIRTGQLIAHRLGSRVVIRQTDLARYITANLKPR